MCRREHIKPRGLVARSWLDWEAGSRPNWDYQDLLSRLFTTSPVHLGWAADYTPAEPPAARKILASSHAKPFAGGTAGVKELIASDSRHGHALLHLPPDTRDFTGRAELVSEVTHLIAAAATSSGTAFPIVCLSGQAGIGKTTLAIHVAHRVSGEFPDGQLYANLRGTDPRGQHPAEVLAGFLRELGVDGTDIPEGLDERARMYRAELAGRSMLVVLDNAADEAQVRPLLPGSPGCAVLVTSTSRMAALPGATAVPLDLMPPGQAAELLTAIVGPARAHAEPEAIGEVARLCGYLPLALRIAGARLASRPAWKISWFANRLSDENRRLDLLKAGDLEVRASFGLSYRGRDNAEQRAFRMLGLLPADFPAWNLAALLETDPDEAEQLLEQLVDAVLADIAGVDATGLIRYRLHDLLRAFARECLLDTEPAGVREEALARLADQYISAAKLASALVHPGAPAAAPADQLLMEDVVRGDPWTWFMAERASLVRLTGLAHAARLRDRTWKLAEMLPARPPTPAPRPGCCGAWAPCTGNSAATTTPSPCSPRRRRSSTATPTGTSGRLSCGTSAIPTGTRAAWPRPSKRSQPRLPSSVRLPIPGPRPAYSMAWPTPTVACPGGSSPAAPFEPASASTTTWLTGLRRHAPRFVMPWYSVISTSASKRSRCSRKDSGASGNSVTAGGKPGPCGSSPSCTATTVTRQRRPRC